MTSLAPVGAGRCHSTPLGAARWRMIGLAPRAMAKVRATGTKGADVEQGHPISYLSLEVGTPVASSEGTLFGTVEHVLQVPELDLFDGIVVRTPQGLRFVDRDQITEITTATVRCSLSDDQLRSLPEPDGTLVLHPDIAYGEGKGLSAWYGRMFGRLHWKELE